MDDLLSSNEIYTEFSTNQELSIYNNVLGTYTTEDFTIRLAYYIHEKLEKLNSGVINYSNIDDETLQAYSTFLHETVHWRQHIGSISGFILSMVSPSQNFCLNSFLKIILEEIGPVKPLQKYYYDNVKTNTPDDRLFQNLNNTLNNFYDLDYYTHLAVNPKKLTENIHLKNGFFISYGHSTIYTYINTLQMLSHFFNDDEIDIKTNELKAIISSQENSPNKEFNAFKEEQIVIPPIGLKQIFEGQARFIQLQFLYFSNSHKYDVLFFQEEKLLDGVYGEAFDLFLRVIEKDYPSSFNDSLIPIFLVICDLAINPGNAFPLDVGHDESFFFEVIPGIRFYDLCHAAKELIESDQNFIVRDYSKDEYSYIANLLCDKLYYPHPSEVLEKVISWNEKYDSIHEIMCEEKTYSYKNELLPIRFLLSKFIILCVDKQENPEFFCWTGACSAGEKLKDSYISLTEKHKAPFINQKDLDVYAAYQEGINEDNIEILKDHFTTMNILSNLIKQWIINEGEFNIDFINEIRAKHNESELKEAYSTIFKNHFNFDLNDFVLL